MLIYVYRFERVNKLRAKARQQKLLAQMSTSQKAFLSNPNNKQDVEAFNGIYSTKIKIVRIEIEKIKI